MIERACGTIIYASGGSSMDPMTGPAERAATAIGSGALRAYALEELGLIVTSQRLEPSRAALACRVIDADDRTEGWCRRCGCQGIVRDGVTRRLAHESLGWQLTVLAVSIRR
ncbi:hypothetical protein A6F55_21080 [Prescottella equi]|nr:hypothetical protein A6F55_21080 [Prescottella equi]